MNPEDGPRQSRHLPPDGPGPEPGRLLFLARQGCHARQQRWWDAGKPAPVAAVYGLDPLLFLISSTSFPKDVSEYEFAGGINGSPIEVFKSDVTGLTLPAHAEIIVEGFSLSRQNRP